MVHHLDGAGYTDLKDSTSNHWDITSMGGNPVFNQPGKIGTCVDFDGSGDYLKADSFQVLPDGSHTASAWVRVDGNAGQRKYVFESHSDAAVSLLIWTNETLKSRTHTSDVFPVCYASTRVNPSNPQWYYVTTRVNAANDILDILVNGVYEHGTLFTGTVNPATGLDIGMSNLNSYWMNGKIDEIHVSNVARSDAWVSAEYINMVSPSTFTILGEEELLNTGWAYGSPMDIHTGSNEWVWTNFTWQNPDIPEGTMVGWRIFYRDATHNVMSTNIMSFRIEESNLPPNPPYKPRGNTQGVTHMLYRYTTTTTDPENDSVYYWWDWGDGTNSSWLGPYSSIEKVSALHRWNRSGVYLVKVKAKDTHGAESGWSDPLRVVIRGIGTHESIYDYELDSYSYSW